MDENATSIEIVENVDNTDNKDIKNTATLTPSVDETCGEQIIYKTICSARQRNINPHVPALLTLPTTGVTRIWFR